jgi:hypothetical protein
MSLKKCDELPSMDYKPDKSLLRSQDKNEIDKINQLIQETEKFKSHVRVKCYMLALLCLFISFCLMAIFVERIPYLMVLSQGAGGCGCLYFIVQADKHNKRLKKEKNSRIEKLKEYIRFVNGTGIYTFLELNPTEKPAGQSRSTKKPVYYANTIQNTMATEKCKAGLDGRCKLMKYDQIYKCPYYKECKASFKTEIIERCNAGYTDGDHCWGCWHSVGCHSKYKSYAAYAPPPF